MIPQLSIPALAAKHPMAFKKTAAYLADALSVHRSMAKPTMAVGRSPAMKMPL